MGGRFAQQRAQSPRQGARPAVSRRRLQQIESQILQNRTEVPAVDSLGVGLLSNSKPQEPAAEYWMRWAAVDGAESGSAVQGLMAEGCGGGARLAAPAQQCSNF
ncbi:hypothetical protein AVEN_188835-1 [Araneus ventricosus]|uniref:Uncharacterized protein n=1 Tax=Araneus ventricosus TaxID=182803 RepID=A0A4Y2BSA4_ARAVE|nr:hypothetical protein AVEN_188835-1 [Araneus ventricosus]